MTSDPAVAGDDLTSTDRVQIAALYAAYNETIDSGHGSAWADTFAPAGEFVRAGAVVTGPAQLAAFVTDRWTALGESAVVGVRHWNAGLVVVGSGTRATGSCDLLVAGTQRATGERVVVASGRYEDVLELAEAGWRFTRRTLTLD